MVRREAHCIPAPELLRELLDYFPETGKLLWKKPLSNRVQPGKEAGACDGQGYRVLMVRGYITRVHRAIWAHYYGAWPTGFIDHVNGNRADNRISNLRDVSNAENLQNNYQPQANSTTNLRGVWLDKRRGLFVAELSANRRRHRLGYFKTAEEAHQAYLGAKLLYHSTGRAA
jgi:hypothetical protein